MMGIKELQLKNNKGGILTLVGLAISIIGLIGLGIVISESQKEIIAFEQETTNKSLY